MLARWVRICGEKIGSRSSDQEPAGERPKLRERCRYAKLLVANLQLMDDEASALVLERLLPLRPSRNSFIRSATLSGR
jgi:hypothetical protein